MSNVQCLTSSVCFVPGCKTGYSSDRKLRKNRGEKSPSLFQAPKDPMIFQQWQQAISRTDKMLSSNDAACALHFLAEDILYFYETKLPDGTINRIKRGKPKLKDGSVPSIIPNMPSNPIKRKTPPCERTEMANIKREKYVSLPDLDVETDEAALMFKHLKNNLNIICTPNKQWSGTFIPGKNQVLFVEWDENYTPKKKIVIYQDMSFKVLFEKTARKTDIKLEDGDRIITSFVKLENILKLIK